MATILSSSLSFSRLPCIPSSSSLRSSQPSQSNLSFPRRIKPISLVASRSSRRMTLSCSASSSGDSAFNADVDEKFRSKRKAFAKLTREIEPLDISVIQKDVSPETVDAMERSISEMLGLLPSDKFQIHIESPWEHLSDFLFTSIMAGYALKNVENKLYLEKNFELDYDSSSEKAEQEIKLEKAEFDDLTIKTLKYMIQLKSRLLALKKELLEVQRKMGVLDQLKQSVGDDEDGHRRNELLEYLKSSKPEKLVAGEMPEPICPVVKEAVNAVVYALFAILSPEVYPDPTTQSISELNQRQIFLTRDYLARVMIWCMLLGHYIRGFEFRLELSELLGSSSSGDDVEKTQKGVSSDDEDFIF
ncbi:OLC1v1009309C1 [Oldenlandia corymbosa var. corymbosa]|uniref:OLC1v1009309C1 n=1 Tax=Oldenlandia corymbosa var. corymbosa TaxID=529605 RepID=A0AAV1DRJ5_OLDCO|nr:OLC1v1009309C1 [Oldenlandia corymbosa var. corymbosa]